jgi:hypothetical protein
MTPQHGSNVPQTSNAPITITVPEWIVSNTVISIVIQRSNDNFSFRGFKIQAQTQTGELIGSFLSSSDVGLVNCNGVPGSAATHVTNNAKAGVVIQWQVPDASTPILFNFV